MSSNIIPVQVASNNSYKASKKPEEQQAETATQSDNSGKIIAGMTALGVAGVAAFMILKNKKGSDEAVDKLKNGAEKAIPDNLKESFNTFLHKVNTFYTGGSSPEIEQMISHENDDVRVKAIHVLMNNSHVASEFREKMVHGLMKKSVQTYAHDGIHKINSNALLTSLFKDIPTVTPEYMDGIVAKLPECDELSGLHVSTNLIANPQLSKHLKVEHLDKISEFLNKSTQKEFELLEDKGFSMVTKIKYNTTDLGLSCKTLAFNKSDISEQSIARVTQVLDDRSIADESKLTFISNIFDGKLKTEEHSLAMPFKKKILDKVLDSSPLEFTNVAPTSIGGFGENKFALAGRLYSSLQPPGEKSLTPEETIAIADKMKKLFVQTKEAGLIKNSLTSDLQKSYFNCVLSDELNARDNLFRAKYKDSKPSIDDVSQHTDEMIGHFVNAKDSLQDIEGAWGRAYHERVKSIFQHFEIKTELSFNFEDYLSKPDVRAKQESILKKLHDCGEKHFGIKYQKFEEAASGKTSGKAQEEASSGNASGKTSGKTDEKAHERTYEKYYQKTESGGTKFDYDSFRRDKTKGSRDYISKAASELKDDSLNELLKKMNDGSLTEDEFKSLKRKILIKFHPDKNPNDRLRAEETTKILLDHFEILESKWK